jgi:hypothetical protein
MPYAVLHAGPAWSVCLLWQPQTLPTPWHTTQTGDNKCKLLLVSINIVPTSSSKTSQAMAVHASGVCFVQFVSAAAAWSAQVACFRRQPVTDMPGSAAGCCCCTCCMLLLLPVAAAAPHVAVTAGSGIWTTYPAGSYKKVTGTSTGEHQGYSLNQILFQQAV